MAPIIGMTLGIEEQVFEQEKIKILCYYLLFGYENDDSTN